MEVQRKREKKKIGEAVEEGREGRRDEWVAASPPGRAIAAGRRALSHTWRGLARFPARFGAA